MIIIRFVFKFKIGDIIKVLQHNFGQIFTQHLVGRGYFLLLDPFILVSLGFSLQALPGQLAFHEVHQANADGLQVVSPALLKAFVSICRGIPRGSRQTFVLLPLDVLSTLGVFESLRQSEIDNENCILILLVANQKVVWLYVSMDIAIVMQSLNSAEHLICYH